MSLQTTLQSRSFAHLCSLLILYLHNKMHHFIIYTCTCPSLGQMYLISFVYTTVYSFICHSMLWWNNFVFMICSSVCKSPQDPVAVKRLRVMFLADLTEDLQKPQHGAWSPLADVGRDHVLGISLCLKQHISQVKRGSKCVWGEASGLQKLKFSVDYTGFTGSQTLWSYLHLCFIS